MTSKLRPKQNNRQLSIIPVKLPKIQSHQRLDSVIIHAFEQHGLTPHTGDVVSVASKIASISEGQTIQLDLVQPSKLADLVSARWKIDRRLAQVIIDESDAILGGVKGFVLTIKHGILTPNAGVDQKNSVLGTVTTWPKNPDLTADKLRMSLRKRFRANIGVEIVDSRVTALRMGTIGLAIGISGFSPIRDERGEKDLYGRSVSATRANVADDIASASHLVMGERNERVGLVLVRGARIHLGRFSSELVRLDKRKCLISANLPLHAIAQTR
ncbi:MAG TPA: coenzyme F420-0:L-glutamate ligase [Candidatus Bathyarchaeia archaeon]|nr:coenzyme F420-0:L-glutamate ligase [Candidatus Bathyarchaeia archaeon]